MLRFAVFVLCFVLCCMLCVSLLKLPSMVKKVKLAREFSSMLCFAVLCALLCAVLYAVLFAQSVILNGASLATLASPFGQEACFCFASAFCRVWGCLRSS